MQEDNHEPPPSSVRPVSPRRRVAGRRAAAAFMCPAGPSRSRRRGRPPGRRNLSLVATNGQPTYASGWAELEPHDRSRRVGTGDTTEPRMLEHALPADEVVRLAGFGARHGPTLDRGRAVMLGQHDRPLHEGMADPPPPLLGPGRRGTAPARPTHPRSGPGHPEGGCARRLPPGTALSVRTRPNPPGCRPSTPAPPSAGHRHTPWPRTGSGSVRSSSRVRTGSGTSRTTCTSSCGCSGRTRTATPGPRGRRRRGVRPARRGGPRLHASRRTARRRPRPCGRGLPGQSAVARQAGTGTG